MLVLKKTNIWSLTLVEQCLDKLEMVFKRIDEHLFIGHFSAIAGYNEKRDLALVMDVAKFKYPAFWCPLPLL